MIAEQFGDSPADAAATAHHHRAAVGEQSVLSLAQIGVTVGVALLLNALLVRTFMLPAVIVVFDRWLWWPREAVSDEPEREPVTASA
ncbi:MMPL family transporter [Mycobacterium asiaticum]|uniref:Membrane transport protein MMPL domain-containing protein n=1 Tax=Mycobacterium asiaticum TaxID=1790 RepID=A0A1A3CMY8_MYCAS|nr:MMPL family transporter [Mycobacterium asiaticum]OBI87256.1 hypothetical protein A9X01_01120 [Mycobacterium asiaticum]